MGVPEGWDKVESDFQWYEVTGDGLTYRRQSISTLPRSRDGVDMQSAINPHSISLVRHRLIHEMEIDCKVTINLHSTSSPVTAAHWNHLGRRTSGFCSASPHSMCNNCLSSSLIPFHFTATVINSGEEWPSMTIDDPRWKRLN